YDTINRALRHSVDPAASAALLSLLEIHQPKQGPYRELGEIASGGMGKVLKVWDEDLSRVLAMKIMRSDLCGGDNRTAAAPSSGRLLDLFLNEAQITSQLEHPGIVPVHDLGLDSMGRVYFTMPLIRGHDLKHIFQLVQEGKEGWTQTRMLSVI